MSSPEFHLSIFLFGCLGALAPEVIRHYNLRTKKAHLSWSWFYVLATLAFTLLGGVIAWILPSTNYYGAFYAGVAFPNIVNSLVRNSDPEIVTGQTEEEVTAQDAQAVNIWRDYWRGL